MQVTTLYQRVRPSDRDRDGISNIEQPQGDVIEIKKSTAKETDKAASSERVP
jgi:hypothetical protein